MTMSFLNKLLQRGTTSTEIEAQATDAGEALIAAGMAPYEEITRGGYAFHVTNTTPTVGTATLPDTTCAIGFWNSAPDGGKCAIIDAIYALNAVAHASLGQAGLIYVVGQTRVAALTNAFVVRKNNGYGPGADNVLLAATGGAVLDAVTGVDIGWLPIGPTANISVVSLPGVVLFAAVNGRIIVPPGRQFGVNVMSNNAGNTYNVGIMWHEKKLTLY